jgi:hypothetical protein
VICTTRSTKRRRVSAGERILDGKSTQAGKVTDELTPVEVDGRHLMKRIQIVKYDTVKFESRHENVFDPATMAPVSMDFWKNGPLINHREFDGTFVYFHTPGTPMKIVEYPKAVVDFLWRHVRPATGCTAVGRRVFVDSGLSG